MRSEAIDSSPNVRCWFLSLIGLGTFVFGIVALSGPGRIDIVDGQTRFEVGRSLVEHGDSALRDPRIWFGSFPGRDGLDFTYYRFPQSFAAAGAIVVADGTGNTSEGRRHFFFVWTSAVAAALLAVLYACFFRRLGLRPSPAILWALGGICCTPNWFYGTSTFDEILGSLTIVAATATAWFTREKRSTLGAIGAGLLMGLAFNVKQPLGAFLIAVMAIHDDYSKTSRQRLLRAGVICLGLASGIAVQQAYDYSKFPFDKKVVHADQLKTYAPVYAFHPAAAAACFAFSPGCGIFWYCPPLLLGFAGVFRCWQRGERKVVGAVAVTTLAFIGFHCFVSFFKGDIAWGPRYLTPWFAFLWLFTPWGASLLSRRLVGLLVGLGLLVQVLALAVDPHRMYVARGVPSAVGVMQPWIYFHPAFSHIVQRPREIVEILNDSGKAEEFTAAPTPTFTFPVIDPPYFPETGPTMVQRYQVLRSFRPWWISQRFLPEDKRPVNLDETLAILGAISLGGVLLMIGAVRGGRREIDAKRR